LDNIYLYGDLPLHKAIKENNIEVARELINKGINLDSQDLNGSTALYYAIKESNIEVSRELINKGADLNIVYKENSYFHPEHTALTLATQDGQTKIVEALIRKGIDINKKVNGIDRNNHLPDKKSALLIAIENNQNQIANRLIESGATNYPNGKCETPLSLAFKAGELDIAEIILAKGIPLDGLNRSSIFASTYTYPEKNMDLLCSYGIDVRHFLDNSKNDYNNDSFKEYYKHASKAYNRFKKEFKKSNTPLQAAFFKAIENNDYEVVQGLLSRVKELANCNTKEGNTSLGFAIESGNDKIVTLLLRYGADVNQKDIRGETALHKAARKGNTDVVNIIIDKGANINAKNDNGFTPIEVGKHDKIRDLLVEKGVDRNILLHSAAIHNQTNDLKNLIKQGLDVNAKDKNGKTPLELAISYESRKLLISYGATITSTALKNVQNPSEKKELKELEKEYKAAVKQADKELHQEVKDEALRIVKIMGRIDEASKEKLKNSTTLNPELMPKLNDIAKELKQAEAKLKEIRNSETSSRDIDNKIIASQKDKILNKVNKDIDRLLKDKEQEKYLQKKITFTAHKKLRGSER
jgi:ankyrin repeat protein